MFKKLFFPLLKRFLGLFISMVVVNMLALGLLMAFTNSLINLNDTYNHYLEECNTPNLVVETGFEDYSDDIDNISNIKGVKDAEKRITIDCYLKRSDNRQLTSRIYTYSDEQKLDKYVVKKALDLSEDIHYVSVEARFAENNNFKLGDTISLGAFGFYFDFTIKEIVQSPETIYVRVKDYIWSDNTDFGVVYLNIEHSFYLLSELAKKVNEKINQYEEFKEEVERIIGIDLQIPDIREFTNDEEVRHFMSKFGNQVLIKKEGNIDSDSVKVNVDSYLETKSITIKDSRTLESTTSYVYIHSAMRQIRVAAIFLPIFFYSITLFVMILFINQMVKSMTSDIGILMSIGVRGKEITRLFSFFIFLMSAVSSVFGIGIAAILRHLLNASFMRIYQIPYVLGGFNIWLLLLGIVLLIIIGQLAVLASSKAIYRITPKDAMISNESKRKRLPKWLESFIEKAPVAIKLGINSVAQNLRRFLVSTFSIFAALTMTMITIMFVDAKNALIDQATNKRLGFDCQVYLSEVVSDDFINQTKSQTFVTKMSSGYFTYLEISNGKKSLTLQTLALEKEETKELIYIPDYTGKGKTYISEVGIILDKSSADQLGVKKGEVVTINGHEVIVSDISYQYFNLIEYMSDTYFETLGIEQKTSTFIINTSDETALLNYLADRGGNSLTVFSSSLKEDLTGRLSSVNTFIYIMVGFSIMMGLVILVIMTQNALMEQKRQLSIFRAVGFRVIDVSNVWMTQSVLQLLISNLFAVPFGLLFSKILYASASSATQVYPFIVNPISLLICFGFILFVIGFAHFFAMFNISRWNLADNTRSRE